MLVWGLDAMAVTFIAPHSLHARPMVVPRGHDPVVESLELASYGAAAVQTAAAAVPVTPLLGPGTWRDFHLAEQLVAAGEQAMEEALPVRGAPCADRGSARRTTPTSSRRSARARSR